MRSFGYQIAKFYMDARMLKMSFYTCICYIYYTRMQRMCRSITILGVGSIICAKYYYFVNIVYFVIFYFFFDKLIFYIIYISYDI